jgi:hypothetical protein
MRVIRSNADIRNAATKQKAPNDAGTLNFISLDRISISR